MLIIDMPCGLEARGVKRVVSVVPGACGAHVWGKGLGGLREKVREGHLEACGTAGWRRKWASFVRTRKKVFTRIRLKM